MKPVFFLTLTFFLVVISHLHAIIWTEEVVDSIPINSTFSIATDVGDLPHIVYHGMDHNLKYARWDGVSWQIEVVDTSSGHDPSLVLDSFDRPHIVYNDESDEMIKYASRIGGSWSVELIDTSGTLANPHYAIDLDSQDYPHLVYNETSTRLKYAFFDGLSWRITYIETTPPGEKIELPSIALDEDDRPHIVYCHEINGNAMDDELLYSYWNENQWIIQQIDGGDWTVSECFWPSLRIDSQGFPHIGYGVGTYYPEEDWRYYIRYAHSNGLNWTVETFDLNADDSYNAILDLDRWDNPHIAYRRSDGSGPEPNSLGYAQNNGSQWVIRNFAEERGIDDPFIALDDRDEAHIAFRESNLLIYGKVSPDVRLIVSPDTASVIPGDTLSFTVTVENNRGFNLSGDLWMEVELPSGNEILIPEVVLNYTNPNTVNLSPFEVLNLDYIVEIPITVPAGDYKVIGNVGLYGPNVTVDRDFFEVFISSP